MSEFRSREVFDWRITIGGRWVRAACFYGSPPGSHIGLWRTRTGSMRGVNLRVGRRYLGPCLTVLLHTRPDPSPVAVALAQWRADHPERMRDGD